MKLLAGALLLSASVLLNAATPKLSFIKSFPGSVPAYCSVEIDKAGALRYQESPTDDQPVKAQLPESDAASLFALAEQLEFFKSPIESGLKVANTGKKTFRYENEAGVPTEVVFNYSTDLTAQQLLDRFEQIAASERAFIDLDRTVHFDKLGVNDALAEVEALWLRKQLAAPTQFVPLLNRIVSRESFMHLVRERAARLKDEFLAPVPADLAASPKK
jgi:sugar/nucleoside kinase (ribokinase family)